jgi:hypothetical protein
MKLSGTLHNLRTASTSLPSTNHPCYVAQRPTRPVGPVLTDTLTTLTLSNNSNYRILFIFDIVSYSIGGFQIEDRVKTKCSVKYYIHVLIYDMKYCSMVQNKHTYAFEVNLVQKDAPFTTDFFFPSCHFAANDISIFTCITE